jgi:hypothetical protein
MGDIKETNALTHCRVFGKDSSARIFNRHQPATEICHFRIEIEVLLVQR